MKLSNYLEKISGVGIYPMLSLLLFMVFFITAVFIALRTSEDEVNHMKNLPNEK